MPKESTTTSPQKPSELDKIKTLFILVATVLLIVGIVASILGVIKIVSSGKGVGGNTITVSGRGEAFAVPDIATISFSVQAEEKGVAAAQEKVTETSNKTLAALRKLDIDEKDMKQSGYAANPRYEYRDPKDCNSRRCNPVRTLVGYEVRSTVTVKVREVEKAGEVLGTIGGFDVSNINGPNLEIDDPDAVQAEARNDAIKNARKKAKDLASELGVRLGKVVSFSEGGGYPSYGRLQTASFDAGESIASAPIPEIPVGENQVVSTISITYRIK